MDLESPSSAILADDHSPILEDDNDNTSTMIVVVVTLLLLLGVNRLYMKSENISGGSGGCTSFDSPCGSKKRKRETYDTADNENFQRYSSQSDMAGEGSEVRARKRCRDDEGTPKGCAKDEEVPGNLQDAVKLSKVGEDIQQLSPRVDFVTYQVFGSQEAGRASAYDASVPPGLREKYCKDLDQSKHAPKATES